jgi:4-phosphopantoate--beta-alanine ligase
MSNGDFLSQHAADPSHPRYASLLQRQKMERAMSLGMLADSALIAHGRGEAFDYLLGEQTHPFATEAIYQAIAALKQGERPVLCVNGNTVALAGREMLELASRLSCPIEINIFYRTDARIQALLMELNELNQAYEFRVEILGATPDAEILGLKGPRAKCESRGIYSSDVVFVPLEDGDRCEALVAMGKTVIVVDLNPLSRSASKASITIVNELSRTIQTMNEILSNNQPKELNGQYSNEDILHRALQAIREGIR